MAMCQLLFQVVALSTRLLVGNQSMELKRSEHQGEDTLTEGLRWRLLDVLRASRDRQDTYSTFKYV
ncbi:hypothetical protein NQZ68_014891 [Dissostichus eleginoides]|nr:hypothetical protein NQZ68_014891 [Dissostichus eleginoides]